jgi:protein-tyrosine phosphatase
VIDGVVNMRDLGGHPTPDGRRVRAGLVHRSGHLRSLARLDGDSSTTERSDSDEVERAFRRTGIATVFDLRTVAEVTRSPDVVPEPVEVVHLDVLADATESIAAHLSEIFADPTSATRVFSDGVIDRHYQQTYRNLVLLDSARTAYSQLFALLVATDAPVLFHCTAGKDRTGWAAAVLLSLLGVDDDTTTAEYLRSNDHLLEAFGPYLQQFADMGGDPSVIEPAFLVERDYLDAAFDTAESEFGSIERYFADGLGVDADTQNRLRDRLIATGAA